MSDLERLEYFDLYGEMPVFSRAGLQQFRFIEYSYTAARLAKFHRERPYRAL
ncbi:hypothetical protein [Hymenobacter busanensis]|uniref:hypothetical protein n=1 Tax=Hymenobacter busanensis TaxID=2607656 RepID=UPI001366DC10|nr:hypothetical protein [Hymenobacter busanensis]QHJ07891.1 hypothetical protein GUY19_11610 [Hymenobacter busanensis]